MKDNSSERSIQIDVPGLGCVILYEKLTFGEFIEAIDSVDQVEENGFPDGFANSILASLLVEPTMTPAEVADLPDDVIDVLAGAAAEILEIYEEFDRLPEHLSAREKLYQVYSDQLVAAFAESIVPLERLAQSYAERIRESVLPSIQQVKYTIHSSSRKWVDLQKQIQETLERIEADAETIAPLLDHANLWLAPTMILGLLPRLKKVIEQENATPEMVIQVFVDYYEEYDWLILHRMVDSWNDNPHFSVRMPIINDALEAHVGGKYTLAIPTLLCQIEGILSSILARPAGSTTGMIKDAMAKHSEFLKVASKDLLVKFAKSPIGYGGIKEEFFTPAKFLDWLKSKGYEERYALNRHAILHGVHINYANVANSLRTFLLLDVLNAIA